MKGIGFVRESRATTVRAAGVAKTMLEAATSAFTARISWTCVMRIGFVV